MKAFRFVRARNCAEASALLAQDGVTRLHAGGVDLLERMKERLEQPEVLVSLLDASGMDGVDIAGMAVEEGGDIRIGARVTLAQLASSKLVQKFLPTLAQAALDAASPQLRNRATIAGNLLQHTRCGYYRHASFPCWKRGGEACPVHAEGGVQEHAGILEIQSCASAHPSSVAPVLGTLDAELLVRSGTEHRTTPFEALWAEPRSGVAGDTVLAATDVIEAIVVPARDERQYVGHSEIRQKAAFDWALVTCSVRYELEGDKIKAARVWFGSVAPTPWRAAKAEQVLVGKRCTDALAEKAADAALADATPLPDTKYKVHLAKVALKRALAAARER